MNLRWSEKYEMIHMGKAQPEACIGCRWCMLSWPEMAIDVAAAVGPRTGGGGTA